MALKPNCANLVWQDRHSAANPASPSRLAVYYYAAHIAPARLCAGSGGVLQGRTAQCHLLSLTAPVQPAGPPPTSSALSHQCPGTLIVLRSPRQRSAAAAAAAAAGEIHHHACARRLRRRGAVLHPRPVCPALRIHQGQRCGPVAGVLHRRIHPSPAGSPPPEEFAGFRKAASTRASTLPRAVMWCWWRPWLKI